MTRSITPVDVLKFTKVHALESIYRICRRSPLSLLHSNPSSCLSQLPGLFVPHDLSSKAGQLLSANPTLSFQYLPHHNVLPICTFQQIWRCYHLSREDIDRLHSHDLLGSYDSIPDCLSHLDLTLHILSASLHSPTPKCSSTSCNCYTCGNLSEEHEFVDFLIRSRSSCISSLIECSPRSDARCRHFQWESLIL